MPDKLIAAAFLALAPALALTAPPGALAVPSQLTVTNLAQPGLESDVPQPPVSVAARGSCGTPYSAHEANTGTSPCAPGSWPANPGGSTFPDWRPEVRTAGGDRLQLTFDAPAEQVRYASTTNFPKGFLNPAGQPHPNVDIITARDAQPTSDPRVWSVQLPRFDDPGHSSGTGYTFPVVAREGSTWRNFAVSLRGPRWNNDQTHCGYFWNPDQFNRTFCIFDYAPGPPPVGDRQPPSLSLQVHRRQHVRRLRAAILYARCNEVCTVKATGRLRVGRRSFKLRAASTPAAAGKRVRLRVRLTSAATRVLRRAVRRNQRATIVLAVRARDATGNRTEPIRRTIRAR